MSHHGSQLIAALLATVTLFVAPVASSAAVPDKAQATTLDQSVVQTVIGGIATELREAYIFPDRGEQAAAALETALAENAYAGITDPSRFAAVLTEQLRGVTKDSHMRVIYGSPFGKQPAPTTPQGAGFEVKRLDDGIGYIHLSRFVPPDVFKPAADAAMREIADTSALIIDMRDNGGGHPASVAYLASFLFEPAAKIHLNDLIWRNRGARTFRTESFWTSPTPVSYLDKPVYVLVGPKTYSAGEEFAYDLQVLKRVTVVGTKSRGGANPGGLNEVGPDLFVVVPTGRAENPVTHGNWGGVGIQPDVQASVKTTEQTALALATGKPAATVAK